MVAAVVLFRKFLENLWILDLANRFCTTLPSFCRSVLLGFSVRVECSPLFSYRCWLFCLVSTVLWIPALGRWTGLLSVPV